MKARSNGFDRPCAACGAQPGHGCIEDGVEQPMAGMHAARAFNTSGPIVVRHTGRYADDGGAILEEVDTEEVTR